MSENGHTLARPHIGVALLCQKMTRARAPWWMTAAEAAQLAIYPGTKERERLAWRMAADTWRADRGATLEAHSADVARVALMATMLRQDWTPAAAIAWLDGLDEVQP